MSNSLVGAVMPSFEWGDVKVLEEVSKKRYLIEFVNTGNRKEMGHSLLSSGWAVDMVEKARKRAEEKISERKVFLERRKMEVDEEWVGKIVKSKKWGDAEILSYSNQRVLVKFINTGNVENIHRNALYTTMFTDNKEWARLREEKEALRKEQIYKKKMTPSRSGVGFIGIGPYTTGIHPCEDRIWSSMLQRCYNGFNGAYDDCTVCDRWHNFQNFCKDLPSLPGYDVWIQKIKTKSGRNIFHLDKDTKVPGNKVYGPDTCQFIHYVENIEAAMAKTYKFQKDGEVFEVFNLSKWCRENNIHYVSMSNMLSGRSRSHKGYTRIL